jgi:ABC-type lipoprotein release transport system permease subunit
METIITAFGLACFTVAGFFFLLSKVIGWQGISKHKAKVDIGCSIAAFVLFMGTSTLGIFVAVMSGFIASVATSLLGMMIKPKALTPTQLNKRTRSNLDRLAAGLRAAHAEATRH